MSNNVKNDNHKETMADIYNSMSVEQRGLFDADIATAFAVGELKAQGMTPEEISKKLHIKLNKIKKEEPDNGSSENG